MRVMILYLPYLFILTFQLLAELDYPVTPPYPCNLTLRFLLGGKLWALWWTYLNKKHTHFYLREAYVSRTHT